MKRSLSSWSKDSVGDIFSNSLVENKYLELRKTTLRNFLLRKIELLCKGRRLNTLGISILRRNSGNKKQVMIGLRTILEIQDSFRVWLNEECKNEGNKSAEY